MRTSAAGRHAVTSDGQQPKTAPCRLDLYPSRFDVPPAAFDEPPCQCLRGFPFRVALHAGQRSQSAAVPAKSSWHCDFRSGVAKILLSLAIWKWPELAERLPAFARRYNQP
jgi:hypothetical protein